MKRYNELTFNDFEKGQKVFLVGYYNRELTVVSKGSKYITLDNGVKFDTNLYADYGHKLYLSEEQYLYEQECAEYTREIERQLHACGGKRYTLSKEDLLRILNILNGSECKDGNI